MNCAHLPAGWRYRETIDLMRSRKTLVQVVLLSLALTAAALAAGLALCPPLWLVETTRRAPALWLAALVMIAAYIPLHELTHGVLMWALSGVKPNYGLKLPYYAWCGSTAWFDRRSHNAIALAPLLLWTLVLGALAAALPKLWFWPLWLVMITHASGCAGDIWCAAHLLRMKEALLVQDTGVRMRVFVKAKG